MRVAIAGASALTAEGHVMNLGDEAIADTLGAAVAQHASVSRVATALNVRLRGGAPPSGRFSPRPVLGLEREVAAADAVLIGGGTMLQEDVLPRHRLAVRGLLRYQLAVSLACIARRTPYAYALVGAEMLDRPGARRVAKFLIEHAACVAVRDGPSARMVRALASPKRLVVGADAVFLAPWPSCPAVARSRIAVSLRIDCSGEALRLLAQGIDEMFPDTGILLVPTDRRLNADARKLREFRSILAAPERALCFPPTGNWRELVHELESCRLAVGMRMHFIMFAVLAGAPSIGIAPSLKLRSFAQDSGVRLIDGSDTQALGAALVGAVPVEQKVIEALRRRAEFGLAECLTAVAR
jgi:polysaccharide pyruvyl transferase WcaK-like protein